jgi:hypothetical protein
MSASKIVEGLKDAIKGNIERITIDGQTWARQQPRPPRTLIDGTMSRNEVARTLEQIVFTAAKEWQRTITIDRDIRDLLVSALRRAAL